MEKGLFYLGKCQIFAHLMLYMCYGSTSWYNKYSNVHKIFGSVKCLPVDGILFHGADEVFLEDLSHALLIYLNLM